MYNNLNKNGFHFPVEFKKCRCGKEFDTYRELLEHIDAHEKDKQYELFEK